GNILNDGKELITYAWWLTLYPGLAILVTVLSYNLLGEGIRDALAPRLHPPGGGMLHPPRPAVAPYHGGTGAPAGPLIDKPLGTAAYSAFAGPKWRNWQTRTFEGRVG